MDLLFAVLNLALLGLVLYLVFQVVVWITSKFLPIPGDILATIRAIFGVLFLIYAIAIVVGVASGSSLRWPLDVRRWRP